MPFIEYIVPHMHLCVPHKHSNAYPVPMQLHLCTYLHFNTMYAPTSPLLQTHSYLHHFKQLQVNSFLPRWIRHCILKRPPPLCAQGKQVCEVTLNRGLSIRCQSFVSLCVHVKHVTHEVCGHANPYYCTLVFVWIAIWIHHAFQSGTPDCVSQWSKRHNAMIIC